MTVSVLSDEAIVARAKQMLFDGKSDRQVAHELGVSGTSVVRFRQRHGIVSSYSPRAAKSNKVPRRPTARQGLPFRTHGDKQVLKGAAWRALPDTAPVSLLDLEPGMCKWPIGETGPYLFCGAHTEGVYCAIHTANSRSGNESLGLLASSVTRVDMEDRHNKTEAVA